MRGLLKNKVVTGAGVIILCACFLLPLASGFTFTVPDTIFCPTGEETINNGVYRMRGHYSSEPGVIQVSSLESYDLVPPWDIYGWEKEVQVWGGNIEWGAKAQNITQCMVTPEMGYAHIESRAFGTKCRVTLWFGHLTQWTCPKTGVYDVTFSYSYSDGVSEAYYTLHPEFSGELETSATLIFLYGQESSKNIVFSQRGKHTHEYFQDEIVERFRMSCIQGRSYILGTNLSLLAYTDSWDEAWSSSQIEARGMLTKITLERVNTPPGKPSRPVGPRQGVTGREYTYLCSTVDPDGDNLSYFFEWGDGTTSGWRGPYPVGIVGNASHIYHQGNYSIRVKARDEMGEESPWSEPLSVSMPLRFTFLGNGMAFLCKYYFSFLVHWITGFPYVL